MWSESRGILVAYSPKVGHFEGPKMPNFIENPLFVSFRTKSDVHPVRTKSLSKNLFTLFWDIRQNIFWSFCHLWNRKLTSGFVLLCWILLHIGVGAQGGGNTCPPALPRFLRLYPNTNLLAQWTCRSVVISRRSWVRFHWWWVEYQPRWWCCPRKVSGRSD